MAYSKFNQMRVKVIGFSIASAFISSTIFAGEGVDLQQKIAAGSFSKIDYKAGLGQAHERFDGIKRKSEYARGKAARLSLFTKDLTSAASSGFIGAMVKQFNADQGMRNSTFVLVDKHVDPAGNLHIIMAQRINDVKVKIGKVALHFSKDGELYDISGQIQDDRAVQTTPRISGNDAIAAGKKTIESPSESVGSPELSIVGGKLLAYIVLLREQEIPGAWEVTVDAGSGEVLEKSSTLRFLNPPGYPDNGYYTPITGNICAHEGGGEVTVNGWYDNTTYKYYLFNDDEHWQIVQYPKKGSVALYSNPLQNWGTSTRPGMNVAYNFGRIIAFVRDSMNRNSFDTYGAMAVVNYFEGINDPNGGFRREDDVFNLKNGDGGVTGYEFVVLDMVAHEYGHAITHFSSDFMTVGEAGALEEGYADILGTCVEEAFQSDSRDQYPFGRRSTETTFDW
jgi:Zn-dependent metalloprotease